MWAIKYQVDYFHCYFRQQLNGILVNTLSKKNKWYNAQTF
jgi:hypothetical protein